MSASKFQVSSELVRDRNPAPSGLWTTVKFFLQPLSSLKLTVVLLAMSAFIVLAGTLAQVNADVWEAVRIYFRIDMSELMQSRSIKGVFQNLFVWIDCQIFAPPAFFPWKPDLKPWVGFWFPRGWTIGAVMLVNLFSAHLVRFKIQAKGAPLYAGVAVIALGAILTWAVIVTASTADGIQTETVIGYDRVWQLMGLAILAISGCLVFVGLSDGNKPVERVLLLASAVLAGLVSAGVLLIPPLEDPSMRILYQLLKGTVCGLVLLAGCWLVFRKRAGIVLLHAGIGMLMVYEIMVGLNAGTMEASMKILEGDATYYTADGRAAELAIIDLSDEKEDVETIVPGRLLAKGARLEDPLLPFDVEILDFYDHSDLYSKPGKFRFYRKDANEPTAAFQATAGLGINFVAEALDRSVGTDTDSKFDTPSAYVKLINRQTGATLGVHMVTTVLSQTLLPPSMQKPDRFEFDGKTYEVELRFRRSYTPFHISLKDVQQNNYVGTSRPKDYRAIITLTDPSRQPPVKIEDYHIWMNNPLRYGGFTFYQSGVNPADQQGRQTTVLQVVENEGWTVPYLACMITAVAMLFQFFQVLMRFLGKAVRVAAVGSTIAEPQSNRFWSLAAAGVAALLFASVFMSAVRVKKSETKFDLEAFGQVPIFYEGRAQPIDSLARNILLPMNDRETFMEDGKAQPAIRWMLDVITSSPQAEKHQVFRIENLDLQKALGLEKRERYRYSLSEFREKLVGMSAEIEQLQEVKNENLNLYQRKLLSLYRRAISVVRLNAMFFDSTATQPIPLPSPEELKNNPGLAEEWIGMVQAHIKQVAEGTEEREFPVVVPMHIGAADKSLTQMLKMEWETYPTACVVDEVESKGRDGSVSAMKHWKGMLSAYRDNKPDKFNKHVADYLKFLKSASEEDLTVQSTGAKLEIQKTDLEHFFNRVGPLNLASYMYVGAFVLVALGWVLSGFGGMRALHSAAFVFAALTFCLHAASLGVRMYVSGRYTAPVTNLYSASVFIGCAAAFFSLTMELFFKKGIGTTLACGVGYLSLRVASALSTDGDTLAVLQAVLDTQFWLSTHVVTITLGYATTYVAGFIGVIYILGGMFTPAFSDKDRQRLTSMIYGTTCFSIFFSFVGTVLGGLWADDSWGRFWGWDPKENGALIIVIWNAMILHARWGGMIRERGLAALCVLGNIVVSWSFFGVNELGVGLHAYGLTEGRMRNLALFGLSQLVIAALALIPKHQWWSVQANADDPSRVPVDIEPMV